MKKLTVTVLGAFFLTLGLTACGDRGSTLPETGASQEAKAPQGEEAALAELRTKTAPQFRTSTFTRKGGEISYSLYGPTGMAIGKKYPLVVYLGEDAASTAELPYGALVWASPESQAANPCFVLAPQLSAAKSQNSSGKSGQLAMLTAVIEKVVAGNPVDASKIYAVGQAGGGAAAMELAGVRKGLIAACLFVDCQPGKNILNKLVSKPFIFFANAEATETAASMGALEEACRKQGVSYTTAEWSPRLPVAQQEDMVSTMLEKNAPVNLFTFESAPGNSGAYDAWRLEQARNWLFTKTLNK